MVFCGANVAVRGSRERCRAVEEVEGCEVVVYTPSPLEGVLVWISFFERWWEGAHTNESLSCFGRWLPVWC